MAGLDIVSHIDRSAYEKQQRIARVSSTIPFNMKFLDDALGGIFRNDLILLGAFTGAGKTELATHIAANNAVAGNRVAFFALEAEEGEIESRIKFKIAANHYFNSDRYQKFMVTYRHWYMNSFSGDFSPYENFAEKQFIDKFSTLRTFYRKKEYTVMDFQRDLLAIEKDVDLVVIDHLNYFDSDEPNENKATSEIVKKIRDLALLTGIPILLLAHLRKRDRRIKMLIPDLDEFHGTSNITKIATKVILIAKDKVLPGGNKLYPTLIRADKCRFDGSVSRYIGQTDFDITTNSYSKNYRVGFLSADETSFEEIVDRTQLPYWAK